MEITSFGKIENFKEGEAENMFWPGGIQKAE
jgi:hypothetical protein